MEIGEKEYNNAYEQCLIKDKSIHCLTWEKVKLCFVEMILSMREIIKTPKGCGEYVQ